MNTRNILIIFTVAIIIQTFHFIEHIVQFNQHFFLGFSIADSNGLIDELNVEWVHWAYNFSFFFLLVIVYKKLTIKIITPKERITYILFVMAIIIQGYHLVEHTVRLAQWIISNCFACPGLTGGLIDGVLFHFVMNFLVFVYPLGLYGLIIKNKTIYQIGTR